ncbi:MAG: hypothetical protein IJ593_05860 [Lachnospiraceae bacterium]|nr:hypothetical protein [Lachnospiraceae bacterium]
MAMLDYGALVFKNGKLMNRNQMFMDMKSAVNWVDIENVRYTDCDNIDKFTGYEHSDCYNCGRAIDRSGYGLDCKNNPINDNKLNNNWSAYAGDEHLTVCTYKVKSAFVLNKNTEFTAWGTLLYKDNKRVDDVNSRMSLRFTVGDTKVHLRCIGYNILQIRFTSNCNFYNVIYGYAIDSNIDVWNEIKVRYLGKYMARRIDNIIRRAAYNDSIELTRV